MIRGDLSNVWAKAKALVVGITVLFSPKKRLGHPRNYLFSLSTKVFSGSEYPRHISFNFENRSTGRHSYLVLVDKSGEKCDCLSWFQIGE